jgi:putative ABC transport system substrate-binding protein
MRRREFISFLGGAVAPWPAGGRRAAGRKASNHRIHGREHAFNREPMGFCFCAAIARTRLDREPTVAIEYRWAEGRPERFAEIADEFVRLKVDVIVTSSVGVLAAKQATSEIPIVFAVAVDPLASRMVASLARPGGNVTGLSIQSVDLAGKRLELLREVILGLHRLAIVGNVGYSAAAKEMAETQIVAQTLGFEVATFEIQRAGDIEPAFEALKGHAEALYVCGDALVNAVRARISTLALAARLPTMFPNREFAEAGGLMSYGPNFPDLYRRAGDLVNKILRGTKPSDIPVEQPTKFELIINLKTAKALGLQIPDKLIALADEVIE